MVSRSIAAAAVALATLLAPPAHAAPECTDIAPHTRMCSRAPGQTAIVTSPNPAIANPYGGWVFGSPGFGTPGWGPIGGVWIGF